MKKDIEIPQVKDVYVAIVREHNDIYKTDDWNAYIVNDKERTIEMVLIVSRGFNKEKETSFMRHKLEKLPAKSYAKIELVQEDVLALNNEFKVTYFEDNTLFDKSYLFKENSIDEKNMQIIPLIGIKGILGK